MRPFQTMSGKFHFAVFVFLVAYGSVLVQAQRGYVRNVRQNFNEKTNSRFVQQIHSHFTSAFLYTGYASYFGRADVDLPGFKNFFLEKAEAHQTRARGLITDVNLRGGYVRFYNVELSHRCRELSVELASINVRFPHTCYFVLDHTKRKVQKKRPSKLRKHRDFRRSYVQVMKGERDLEPESTTTMGNALDSLEDALALERSMNRDLHSLMTVVSDNMDASARRVVDDELEEQVDLIKQLADLVTRLRYYKDTDSYNLGEYILDSNLATGSK